MFRFSIVLFSLTLIACGSSSNPVGTVALPEIEGVEVPSIDTDIDVPEVPGVDTEIEVPGVDTEIDVPSVPGANVESLVVTGEG